MSNRNERRTAKRQLQYNNTQLMKALCCVSAVLFLVGRIPVAAAWGSSSNEVDASVYGNALNRDWLYDGSTISLKLEGCMWGYVEDNEESGCLEDSSEDGTTYWYQMANCRRAQAVYSLYTGSGCGSGFVESVSTKIEIPSRLCRRCPGRVRRPYSRRSHRFILASCSR